MTSGRPAAVLWLALLSLALTFTLIPATAAVDMDAGRRGLMQCAFLSTYWHRAEGMVARRAILEALHSSNA